jgi:hypothetical protein
MSAFMMLIAINGLVGFALGLLGRSRIAIFVLFGSLVFSASVLLAIPEGQIVWRTVACMFVGQAAFLFASAVLFFSSVDDHSSAADVPHGSAVKGDKFLGKKPARKV